MIHELLMTGEEHATSARDLAKLTGLDMRGVSLLVEKERRAGFPICASSDTSHPGYYLAANKDDMRDYCGRLKHREREIARTRRACARTIETLP